MMTASMLIRFKRARDEFVRRTGRKPTRCVLAADVNDTATQEHKESKRGGAMFRAWDPTMKFIVDAGAVPGTLVVGDDDPAPYEAMNATAVGVDLHGTLSAHGAAHQSHTPDNPGDLIPLLVDILEELRSMRHEFAASFHHLTQQGEKIMQNQADESAELGKVEDAMSHLADSIEKTLADLKAREGQGEDHTENIARLEAVLAKLGGSQASVDAADAPDTPPTDGTGTATAQGAGSTTQQG
jgi:hypothetical protein